MDAEGEDRPLQSQQPQERRAPSRAASPPRTAGRGLVVTAARVAIAVAVAVAVALALALASPSARPSAASWSRGTLFARRPTPPPAAASPLVLVPAAAAVNQPYYQARLRPLALSLGPRHPITARRPPAAVFSDVRLTPPPLAASAAARANDDRAARLAALVAASDGGAASGVPQDAAAYELWDEKTATPGRGRQRQRLSCRDAARRLLPEPFHPSMLVRNRTVPTSWAAEAPTSREEDEKKHRQAWRQPQHPHPSKLSPALWRWDDGAISRAAYDAVPHFFGGAECPLCYDVVRYKLWRGRLYRRAGDCARELFNASAPLLPAGRTRCPPDWTRGRGVEEVLLLAVWLYALPDADLAVHRGDGAAGGWPVLQHNLRRDHRLAGFTIPYPEHWEYGVSARQALGWAACTRARYGLAASKDRRRRRRRGGGGGRPGGAANATTTNSTPSSSPSSCAQAPLVPRAVWRGTTTDPRRGAWLHQLFGTARARLHALSLVHADVLDARLVAVRQLDQTPEMRADKASVERLLAIPSSFAAASAAAGGESLPWGEGGEAAAKRAAAARLAVCDEEDDDEDEGDNNNNEDDVASPLPRAPLYVPMEDFNRWAAVLDADGNGWSSRLFSLLAGASARPVLKQSTPLAAGYEHLFAPGRHFAHFRGDLRDVADVAARWVGLASEEAGGGRGRGRRRERGTATCRAGGDQEEDDDEGSRPSTAEDADAMADEAASLAALTLNKWALLESAAASLEAYAERASWRPAPPSAEWELVPFSSCCAYGDLPAEFLAAVRAGGD